MIRLFGLVIMTASEHDERTREVAEEYKVIQKVAESNSNRIVTLQKKHNKLAADYNQLVAERNKTVRELLDKNRELADKLKKYEDNED